MNIVFLDIDGVLQPYNAETRFYFNNIDQARALKRLKETVKIDYSQYDISDVLAVAFDWNEQAVARLKYILDKTDSKIIISSDWRSEKYPNKMHDLLEIHQLGKYWFKDNVIIKETLPLPQIRHLEIEDSLKKYPIENFVVLDDMKGLLEYYPDNAVITNDYMSITNMNDCIKILKKTK